MRGFVFTIDSFMALLLTIFALSALLVLSNAPRSTADSYSRLYLLADDSLGVLQALDWGAEGALEGESELVAIGRLCSQGRIEAAGEIAKDALEPLVPGQFGFSLEYEDAGGARQTVYSRQKEETVMRTSSARVVFGKYSEPVVPAYGLEEQCPLCGGMPQGTKEGRDFGPIILRLSVWVCK